MKLICVFVFANAKRWFSHDAAQLFVCIGFSFKKNFKGEAESHATTLVGEFICRIVRKTSFHICKNKGVEKRICFRYIDYKYNTSAP